MRFFLLAMGTRMIVVLIFTVTILALVLPADPVEGQNVKMQQLLQVLEENKGRIYSSQDLEDLGLGADLINWLECMVGCSGVAYYKIIACWFESNFGRCFVNASDKACKCWNECWKKKPPWVEIDSPC